MRKWSCGCPDDGVVNGIDAAFFDCKLTLCYLQFGIPIYRCRLLSFFRLLVSLLSFVSAFLSFCPFFLSFLFVYWAFPSEPSLVWYLFPSFFVSFFLNKNQTTVEWRPHWYKGHKICYKATNTEGSIYIDRALFDFIFVKQQPDNVQSSTGSRGQCYRS